LDLNSSQKHLRYITSMAHDLRFGTRVSKTNF
jgi:hypothetical protein